MPSCRLPYELNVLETRTAKCREHRRGLACGSHPFVNETAEKAARGGPGEGHHQLAKQEAECDELTPSSFENCDVSYSPTFKVMRVSNTALAAPPRGGSGIDRHSGRP
jgi:hypothetical protein